jgi:glutamate-1-semialdehyde 2,1-aminomutase
MEEALSTPPVRATSSSKSLDARLSLLVPGGVNSNVRLASSRTFFARGRGSRLWDVDGNEYIDYVLGQGPQFLGHAAPQVTEAVTTAVRHGMVFGAQTELEVLAAESFLEMVDWADQVRFGVSGTEAVQAAFRVARAATGRTKIVRFSGHYHGWLDDVLTDWGQGVALPASRGQLAHALGDSIAVGFNDLAALEATLDRERDVAAVILEPMMFNAGAIAPRDDFLPGVRALCDHYGVVLIFDEVICGFRLAAGGGAEYFGVKPDLAVYGKALAGGWPVSALAGRAELMEPIGTGQVNHSGTFNGSVMSMAAVVAALATLESVPPYERIAALGQSLIEGIRQIAAMSGLQMRVQGVPTAFCTSFGPQAAAETFSDLARDDTARYHAFAARLADVGVWVIPRGIWYLSAAHTESDIAETLSLIETVALGFI